MGCDIHMFIEYRRNSKSWTPLGKEIKPGRNYQMFGILAGVRSDQEFYFKPRGVPHDISYLAEYASRLFINETEGVSIEKANQWVIKGISKFIYDNENKPCWVTNPDHHTHSWLSSYEFGMALKHYNSKHPGCIEPGYEAMLASLARLNELGFEARVVFWFDN